MIEAKKTIKTIINTARKHSANIRADLRLSAAQRRNEKNVVMIATPYWGNVGDHAIVLAEKNILEQCGYGDKIVDFNAVEYLACKETIKRKVRPQDMIVLDGGGNLGDIWTDTISTFVDIISSFPNNRMVIFPESWFFTGANGNWQSRLEQAVKAHKHITIFARDSWSYEQMRKSMPYADIRQAVDSVFFLNTDEIEKTGKRPRSALICIRDDKESTKHPLSEEAICRRLAETDVEPMIVRNDCYRHIKKNRRWEYVSGILKHYAECGCVVTDRFHGFIFSVLFRKPCVIIDNISGKVHNFYNDVKEDITGVLSVEPSRGSLEEVCGFICENAGRELVVSERLTEKVRIYKEDLINAVSEE